MKIAKENNPVPRLGVNIDHIATLRQLRGTPYPDLLHAAKVVVQSGAGQITVHLREDRRHIQDDDVIGLRALRKNGEALLNLEMAATEEMAKFAGKVRPDWVCIVPEKREELTTEGGLNLKAGEAQIAKIIKQLHRDKIKVSLFVEPQPDAIKASLKLGADAVEIHTGAFAVLTQQKNPRAPKVQAELKKIAMACALAVKIGIAPHAGHGIDYQNIRLLLGFRIREFNIGHSIVCRAVMVGLEQAVREMYSAMVSP